MDKQNRNKTVTSEFSLQVIIVVSQLGKLRSIPGRKQILSLLLSSLYSNPMDDADLFI